MAGEQSDLQLMELQVRALFVMDAGGRLRSIREPGYEEHELEPAPRFFLGRTPSGNLWRLRADLPDDLVRELEQLARREPIGAHPTVEPRGALAIRAALRAHAEIPGEYRGPAYWIPPGVPPRGETAVITDKNAALLEAHFPWKLTSRNGYRQAPLAASVAGGRAVSICYCSRLTENAAEAGVETAPAYRARGHASAAVACWADAMRRSGRAPLYSTSWDNLASQGVARSLGMIRYGEDWSVH